MTIELRLPLSDPTLQFLESGKIDSRVDGDVARKTVPYTIIAQVLQGQYEITRLEETAVIHPGEAFLTGANIALEIIHLGDPTDGQRMRVRFVHFHWTCLGWVDLTSLLELPLRLRESQLNGIGPAIEEIWMLQHPPEAETGHIRTPTMTLGHQLQLQRQALTILEDLCRVVPVRPDADLRLGGMERLRPVIEAVRRNLGERYKIRDLADLAHLSPSRFHTLFKHTMGWAPMEYVKLMRLNEARRLLMSTDRTIADIAEETGFSSGFHLTREFKHRFGLSPKLYRAALLRRDPVLMPTGRIVK